MLKGDRCRQGKALGRGTLGLPKGALKLDESQAAAAAGQISLAHAYQDLFRARGLVAAQVLLTLGDTEERRRYLNARQTIDTLSLLSEKTKGNLTPAEAAFLQNSGLLANSIPFVAACTLL